MPRFPSLEWCEALVRSLEADPEIADAAREWAGRSVGVVITKDAGLDEDFCVYAKPHRNEPRLEELRVCEDEDDLEVDEPDFLFKLPFSLALSLLERRLDPLEVLRRGQVKVEGDLKLLITFGQKYQALGERAAAKVQAG